MSSSSTPHPMHPKPDSIAGYRWDWQARVDKWVLYEQGEQLNGLHPRFIGNHCAVGYEGSPEVAEVIRKAREAKIASEISDREHTVGHLDPEIDMNGKVFTSAIEESVVVDKMPDLEPADQDNAAGYSITRGYSITSGDRPLDILVGTTAEIDYKAWSSSLKTELDATKHQLADQERETARLAANLKCVGRGLGETRSQCKSLQTQRDSFEAALKEQAGKVGTLAARLEATQADLTKERVIHRDTTYQLQGAHRARATLEATHADERWQAGAWVMVLLLAFFAVMWYQSHTDTDLHACRANVVALRGVARSARVFFHPLKDATEAMIKLRNNLASVMANLDPEGAPPLKP